MKSPSPAYIGYVIGLLAVVNAFNYMDRIAISILAPAIQADLKISDGQLGLLTGFSFALFYAICGLPIARLADRSVRKNIIAVALAVWSLMTALSGAAQSYWYLFAARVGVGVGEAGCIPPGHSIVCDYIPYKRRPLAFGLKTFGIFLGMFIGLAVGGWLVDSIGWRWAFVAFGLPGLLLSLIVWFTLREPQRGFYDDPAQISAPARMGDILAFLWARKTYVLLVTFTAVNGFVQYGLTHWLPSFYKRAFTLTASSIGLPLGLAIAAGSGVGLLLGGYLANRLAQRAVRFPLLLGACTALLALPAALASIFAASFSVSVLLIAVSTMLWSMSNPAVAVAIYSVAPAGMRATAGAIQIFLTSLLGFGLGPTCVGLLSDALAVPLSTDALRYSLILPICGLPFMALALYLAARTISSDLPQRSVRS